MVRTKGTTMPVHKRSFSLDPRAAEYLARRAKKLKRSASSVLSEIVVEAAQLEARDRVLEELGAGMEIPEREVERWLKKLGAA
jgi:vacuolar-type H+-ATPase subunit E/Vma4